MTAKRAKTPAPKTATFAKELLDIAQNKGGKHCFDVATDAAKANGSYRHEARPAIDADRSGDLFTGSGPDWNLRSEYLEATGRTNTVSDQDGGVICQMTRGRVWVPAPRA